MIDPSWWETLPPSAYRSAAAEILKVGLLRPELLQRLRRCQDAQAVARLALRQRRSSSTSLQPTRMKAGEQQRCWGTP